MSKPLILALAAGLLLPSAALSAQSEITAPDLARHLGIYCWKFPKEKLPKHFAVGLSEIKDGKVLINPFGGFAVTEAGDLTITINLNPDGTYAATLAVGDEHLSIHPNPKQKLRPSASASRCEWTGDIVPNQPMVLMGEFKVVDGAMRITEKVEDVISGFALTIMSTKDAVQEQAPVANAKP